MKRLLSSALVLSFFSTCLLVGCSEETKEKNVSTVDTPNGTKKVTEEKKIESTGDQKSTEAPK